MKNILTIFIAIGILSGCATTGNKSIENQTQESVSQTIVKGKSTKDDVRKTYGDPMSVSFTDSGNEQWTYHFMTLQSKPANFIPIVSLFASGMEGDKKELVVFFNKDGVVSNYAMNTSKVDNHTGILP